MKSKVLAALVVCLSLAWPWLGVAEVRSQGAGPAASGSAGAPALELVGQVGGAIYAVAVEGRYAYVGVGPRLVVLDVSDPAAPGVVGRSGLLPGAVQGVAVAGAYAYVADGGGGLRVVDVSDPASPVEVGFYDTPGSAQGMAVAGAYAYVADYNGGLLIFLIRWAEPRCYFPVVLKRR